MRPWRNLGVGATRSGAKELEESFGAKAEWWRGLAGAMAWPSCWTAAAQIYGAIGRKVAMRGERAWDARVTTSRQAKLGFMRRAFDEARRRRVLYPASTRDATLWTRPR